MFSFFKKILLFSLPLLLFVVGIMVIDPYNMFGSQVFSKEQKKNTAFRLNYALWRYIEFDKNPNENILLGDSRMDVLDNEAVKNLTGRDFYNLSFGGGTLPEIIQTFWYADDVISLEEVKIGLNFGQYNGREKKNRCVEAENILNNKGLYFINQSVINSSGLMLKNAFTKKNEVVGKPVDREKFWERQLQTAGSQIYKDYLYPTNFYTQLKEIAEHCKKKGIKLSFVILPTHIDLQNQILASNREKELERFVQDLYSLGTVYNFHQKSTLTTNEDYYRDPFHFKSEVRNEVIKYIFELQPVNEAILIKK